MGLNHALVLFPKPQLGSKLPPFFNTICVSQVRIRVWIVVGEDGEVGEWGEVGAGSDGDSNLLRLLHIIMFLFE